MGDLCQSLEMVSNVHAVILCDRVTRHQLRLTLDNRWPALDMGLLSAAANTIFPNRLSCQLPITSNIRSAKEDR